jgi:hypothetical protein
MDYETETQLLIFGAWLLCGLLGAAVGREAGKGRLGFCLGILLGPLGLLIAAVATIPGRKTPPSPSPSLHRPAPPATETTPAIPDHLTIARNGAILGTWTYADTLDFLSAGRLVPSDQWHDPDKNRWLPLARLIS